MTSNTIHIVSAVVATTAGRSRLLISESSIHHAATTGPLLSRETWCALNVRGTESCPAPYRYRHMPHARLRACSYEQALFSSMADIDMQQLRNSRA